MRSRIGIGTARAIAASIFALVLAAHLGVARGARVEPHEPLFDGIGKLHHPVSTESFLAQRYFDQGLRFLYAFNHDEAASSFREAVRQDPNLAMGYWGIALALGPNINLPEDNDRGRQAWQAISKAKSLESGVSPAERDYIDALSARYVVSGAMSDAQQRAYADAMRKVWSRHPEDPDAGTLFAESLMDLHPWAFWSADGKPGPDTVEIVTTLDAVLAKHPDHTGANHYLIHSVEASANPAQALPSAQRLTELAPAAGHLVHMPAHIYIRMGRYHDSARANLAAIKADRAYLAERHPAGIYPTMYYPHNIHFLWASYLMMGNRKGATRAARELAGSVPAAEVKAMPEAEFILPVRYFSEVRFAQWDAVMKESAPPPEFAYTTAMWHYARGMALAAQGHADAAAHEQQALDAIAAATPPDRMFETNSAKNLVEIASAILSGERAARAGNGARATAELKRAVAMQDALGYTEPPSWYYPVRETLGYELLAQGNADQAEAVFREDLRRNPDNGWSLAGLVRSLRATGKSAQADAVQARFKKAWAWADVKPDIGTPPEKTAAR
jgi:tetratricopeptide (TPR) repeat protein